MDFVTGVVTAAIGKSKHSDSGSLNSKAGWIGLAKKFCILLMVVVGVRIDILLGTNYMRRRLVGLGILCLMKVVRRCSRQNRLIKRAIRLR